MSKDAATSNTKRIELARKLFAVGRPILGTTAATYLRGRGIACFGPALRYHPRVSEDAWNVANKVLGPAVAAASIALILDKSTDGEVKSPGGYLRGLVERAQIGELHLDRSFYGRLNAAGT